MNAVEHPAKRARDAWLGVVFGATLISAAPAAEPLTVVQDSPSPIRSLWNVDPEGESYFQAPAALGYAAYFGGQDGRFYAVKRTGELLWTFRTGFGIHTAPAVDGHGVIYFGAFNVGLCALHPDGRLKWILPAEASQGSSPAIGPDGTVYYTSSGGRYYASSAFASEPQPGPCLYALAPDGAERWHVTLSRNLEGTRPAVAADGTVYLRAAADPPGHCRLLALSPTGEVRWELAEAGATDPVIGPAGTVYVATSKREFIAVAPDGARRWTLGLDDPVTSPAVVSADGHVYFGSNSGHLYAVSAEGTVEWRFDPADPKPSAGAPNLRSIAAGPRDMAIRLSPLLMANDEVVLASGNSLFSLTREGRLSWQCTLPGIVASAAVADNTGRLYLPVWDNPGLSGKFSAFQGPAGVAQDAWPCYGHDLRGTGCMITRSNALPNRPVLTTDTLNRVAKDLCRSLDLDALQKWATKILDSTAAFKVQDKQLSPISETLNPPTFLRQVPAPFRPWSPWLQLATPSDAPAIIILSTPPSADRIGYALTVGAANLQRSGELCQRLAAGIFLANYP